MTELTTLAVRLWRDEAGQDLIEYALLATFVALVAVAGATLLGVAIDRWYLELSSQANEGATAAVS